MVIKVLYNIFTLGTIKRKKKIYMSKRDRKGRQERRKRKKEKGKRKLVAVISVIHNLP